MIERKWICLLIMLSCFSLLTQNVSATTYSFTDYLIKLAIDDNDNIHEEISFIIENLGDSPISWVEYSLISAPKNLKVFDDEGALLYSIENERDVLIKLREPLGGGESKKIGLKFDISGVVTRFDENKVLTFSYIPEVNVKSFALTVKLPPRSTLASEVRKTGESVSAVYPTPSRIYSDGKKIIVEWAIPELSAQESFRIFLMYTAIEKRNIGYLLGILLGVLLGGAGTFYYFRRRGVEGREITRMVLGEDEQKIYDMLLSSDGEILQDDIAKNTDFSRAKISKLVRRLEEKRIIKKEPYKKTNRLLLRKEFGGKY
ncbi:MAG: helix-turn-helix transcriptional regulator [Candidatus Hydrothermarchaeales archaeon]